MLGLPGLLKGGVCVCRGRLRCCFSCPVPAPGLPKAMMSCPVLGISMDGFEVWGVERAGSTAFVFEMSA